MNFKMNAKLAIKVAILTVGMVGAFVGASTQPISVADGGPIPVCPPNSPPKTCTVNLPPMS